MNFKSYILFLFIFALSNEVEASVIEWQSGVNGFWNDNANWVGGVIPTATDSVIIDGSGSFARVKNNAVALHISVLDSASFGITGNGSVLIENSPGYGILLEGEMRILTGGILEINNTGDNCIYSRDRLTNNGLISINNCEKGIRLFGINDTLYNNGSIEITDLGNWGTALSISFGHLESSGDLTFTNVAQGLLLISGATGHVNRNSKIRVSNFKGEGISVRHDSEFFNRGVISLNEFDNNAFICVGMTTNSGLIQIGQSTGGQMDILIDSFTCCTPTEIYTGTLINTIDGVIQLALVEQGISAEPSTILINNGEIDIMDSSVLGVHMQQNSSATLSKGSTMSVNSVNTPIIIDNGATIDVDSGGRLNIEN